MAKGKRTFQPNNRRRARVHGFRLRMRTRAGRAIVSGRRRKGRRALICLICSGRFCGGASRTQPDEAVD